MVVPRITDCLQGAIGSENVVDAAGESQIEGGICIKQTRGVVEGGIKGVVCVEIVDPLIAGGVLNNAAKIGEP